MRRADLENFVGDLDAPMQQFVRDARVRLVLLINTSGQVLAQHGFTRALDVIGMAALGAGIQASARALAVLLDQRDFEHLHQTGSAGQVFIRPFNTPAEPLILIAVFGEDSSIGLVRVFFAALVSAVAELPGWSAVRPTADAESFERDLTAGLDRLFGGR